MKVIQELLTENYELMKVIYKLKDHEHAISLDQSYDNIKTIIILALDNSKNISFSPY